jgi:DNA repair protein RecN (Recombination protein N)
VRGQLAALGMGDAEFEVRLAGRDPGPAGSDAVEFVIAPNPGVPPGPVREIASGGELSRIMLALTAAGLHGAARGARRGAGRRGAGGAAQAGGGTTVAFDELDAGIGGRTARAVGERLRELAQARQLLCITHLPQIAALGERHFSIVKDTSTSPTVARVMCLDEPEVVVELVRMLGADSSDTAALRHARDLRRAA